MKKIVLFLLIISGSLYADTPRNAEDISYEWLIDYGRETGVTDHVAHFKEIFKKLKVKNLLEFGLGYSTKYFLDSCSKVISVEFITEGVGPDWIKKCLNLYRDYSNWIPIVYFSNYQGDTEWAKYKYLGSENFSKAAYYQTVNHKNYALINNFYVMELQAFINNLMKSHKVDLAFIDPGSYLRGDLVQLLFGKVAVIAAHDTACRAQGQADDVYGYSRIVTPENYEEVFIPAGQGMTVWILKNAPYTKFAEDLKKYVAETS